MICSAEPQGVPLPEPLMSWIRFSQKSVSFKLHRNKPICVQRFFSELLMLSVTTSGGWMNSGLVLLHAGWLKQSLRTPRTMPIRPRTSWACTPPGAFTDAQRRRASAPPPQMCCHGDRWGKGGGSCCEKGSWNRPNNNGSSSVGFRSVIGACGLTQAKSSFWRFWTRLPCAVKKTTGKCNFNSQDRGWRGWLPKKSDRKTWFFVFSFSWHWEKRNET